MPTPTVYLKKQLDAAHPRSGSSPSLPDPSKEGFTMTSQSEPHQEGEELQDAPELRDDREADYSTPTALLHWKTFSEGPGDQTAACGLVSGPCQGYWDAHFLLNSRHACPACRALIRTAYHPLYFTPKEG